ncbi:MAG: AAA family ATPase [Candidatus Aminicenantales bacterium]
MKLAFTGKGGSGKTTAAGVLAHLFSKDGFKVLAVDADPDANLASSLGIPSKKASSLVPISEQRLLIKERTGANPRQFGQLFRMNPQVSDIPEKFSVEFQGIKLLVMGAVRKGGSGCACPENVLLRSLLSEIILNRNEVVIVDMEAGIEHLGRGTASAIDKMVIMVEPGLKSIHTARTIMKLGKEIGISGFGIIGNKIHSSEDEEWIGQRLPRELILGMIPYSEIINEADRKETPLIDALDEKLREEFSRIYTALTRHSNHTLPNGGFPESKTGSF